jgi:formimidoylglutamate deiminase
VRAIEAELTWTGERFERGVRVTVGDDGRIASVERRPPDAAEALTAEMLPHRALLPGFVNAHSHAFQRGLRGRGESFPESAGSFWTWRGAMYSLVESIDRDGFRELTLAAFREMRSAGITAVGEFHYLHHDDAEAADFAFDRAVLEAAAEAGIRLVLLQTCYRQGGPGRPLEPAQRRFRSESIEAFAESLDRLAEALDPASQSLGVVAHSIRAVQPDEVAALWREAVRRDLPFHMHVEEQVREIVECAAAYGARPMELLSKRLDLQSGGASRFTAVHCTHTDRADMARFAAAGGNVCICPTTEANLGDGIADLPGILAAGGRLSLGTDSNARVSMLEEARWLELVQRLARERRGVLRDPRREGGRVATTLLDAATVNGARALGLEAGAVRPGAWADLVALDLGHPELAGWDEETLLESIFLGASDRAIAGTFVGGAWQGADQGP